jgi:Putative prokaryotic signal transducing protein
MKSRKDKEWIAVAETGQDEEAALIAGLLESQDIPCEVEGPTGGSPWPENLGAFGVSRVMVPPERAEEARELIARRRREFRETPLEEAPEPSEEE